ncbi:MAG: PaaI family thioesterase [Acidobacteriaceae bacterium]
MNLPLSSLTPVSAIPPEEDGHLLRRVAELNPSCVVCGHQNPHGMHVTFTAEANGVIAEWIPGKSWESFQGIVHGGVLSTLLDEAMSKAIIASGMEAFTAELRVRFKQKLHTGETVQIRGWMVQKQKRRITAEASLCSDSGLEHAHAWGVFLLPPRSPVRVPPTPGTPLE